MTKATGSVRAGLGMPTQQEQEVEEEEEDEGRRQERMLDNSDTESQASWILEEVSEYCPALTVGTSFLDQACVGLGDEMSSTFEVWGKRVENTLCSMTGREGGGTWKHGRMKKLHSWNYYVVHFRRV